MGGSAWRVVLVWLAVALPIDDGLVAAAPPPAVSLGSGRSAIIEYDLNFQPLRAYGGLTKPVDVTELPDGAILLVDEANRQVTAFEPDGTVRWRVPVDATPLRARPRADGGLLVTTVNGVIALRRDRSVEWRLAIEGIRAAVPLRNGNILVARNGKHGWLIEMTASGEVVWQSGPQATTDADGHWVDAEPTSYFQSVWSLDVGADGTVFATDFDRHQLRVLGPDYRTRRLINGPPHVTDTRLGPTGELAAASPEGYRVWIELPDGTTRVYEPPMRPTCASFTGHGTLLVGMQWEPEAAVLNAAAWRQSERVRLPWRQRRVPVACVAMGLALAAALGLRWRVWPERPRAGAACAAAKPGGDAGLRRRGVFAVATLALLAATYGAWSAVGTIEGARGFSGLPWAYVAWCAVGALALRALNALAEAGGTLSSFLPARWPAPLRHPDRRRTAILSGLAGASAVACLWLVHSRPAAEPLAIGCWLCAQVWLLAAALPPPSRPSASAAPRRVRVLVALVLAGATALRFWQIGYLPDYVHHDHSIFGELALQTLRGDGWRFFERVYGVGRPWVALTAGALEVFGPRYWVLRLTGAVAGVLVVWGTYLLGTALFNRRVGGIAALLVTVNHILVIYSRQPYVMEPVAPFVLGLYCVVAALRDGSRAHWCGAGLLFGWALLAYQAAMAFPVIGLALFVYMTAVYPRAMWTQRSGILWCLAAACIVYLPMLVATAADASVGARASSTVVFLKPDGSVRWDAELWAFQLTRSFGAILYYGDSEAWGVGTGQSMCLRLGAPAFGIGLGYLLTVWWTPATVLMLVWIGLGIFLGTGVLPDPPTHYHDLAALVPIMLVSGVAVDRGLAIADRRGWRPRLVGVTLASVWLAAVSAANLGAVWRSVARPDRGTETQPVLRADLKTLVARIVGADPTQRYYLVRARTDISCADPTFLFFAAQVDVSNLTTDLAAALPVPPVDPASGVTFVVLPSRPDAGAVIDAVYPNAVTEEIPTQSGGPNIRVYRVDAATVRRAADARRPPT